MHHVQNFFIQHYPVYSILRTSTFFKLLRKISLHWLSFVIFGKDKTIGDYFQLLNI